MHKSRSTTTGLAAVSLCLAALVAGCGGSTSKATPADVPPAASPTTGPFSSTGAPTSAPRSSPVVTSTSVAAHGVPPASPTRPTTPAAPAGPSAAQLAPVTNDLDSAGSSLTDSQAAVAGSNVNQAKSQEGSAP